MKRRFLIVGLGSIGIRHLNNLHQLGETELYVLRSRKAPAPQPILAPALKTLETWEEARSIGFDAVFVSNPTFLHVETLASALDLGAHVYLEKPVGHLEKNLDELERLNSLAQKKNLSVFVGCQLRFHPHFLQVEKWIQDGSLGKIHSVSVDFGDHLPDWHPWEDFRTSYASKKTMGGGVVLTMIHEIDYVNKLFGPIKSVYGMGGSRTPLNIEAEDTALLSLKGGADVPIHVRLDYWRKPPTRRLSLASDQGEVVWDYITKTLTWFENGQIRFQNQLSADWNKNELYLSALSHFLETLERPELSRVPLQAGIESLKVALAGHKSMVTEEVVKVSTS